MLYANAMWQSPAKLQLLPELFEQMAEASLSVALLAYEQKRACEAKVLSFPKKRGERAIS